MSIQQCGESRPVVGNLFFLKGNPPRDSYDFGVVENVMGVNCGVGGYIINLNPGFSINLEKSSGLRHASIIQLKNEQAFRHTDEIERFSVGSKAVAESIRQVGAEFEIVADKIEKMEEPYTLENLTIS